MELDNAIFFSSVLLMFFLKVDAPVFKSHFYYEKCHAYRNVGRIVYEPPYTHHLDLSKHFVIFPSSFFFC